MEDGKLASHTQEASSQSTTQSKLSNINHILHILSFTLSVHLCSQEAQELRAWYTSMLRYSRCCPSHQPRPSTTSTTSSKTEPKKPLKETIKSHNNDTIECLLQSNPWENSTKKIPRLLDPLPRRNPVTDMQRRIETPGTYS